MGKRYAENWKRWPDTGICVYCGEPSEVWDHYVPWSWARSLPVPEGLHVLVPACFSCNAIAGAYVPDSLVDKRAYIAERLRARNRNLLMTLPRTDAELRALGPFLRSRARAYRAQQQALLRRLEVLESETRPAGQDAQPTRCVDASAELRVTPRRDRQALTARGAPRCVARVGRAQCLNGLGTHGEWVILENEDVNVPVPLCVNHVGVLVGDEF